jgi:hypothetical protein
MMPTKSHYLPRERVDFRPQGFILGFLTCQEPTRQPYLLCDTRGREHIRIAELILAAGEVTDLDEPELDQRFQTVIHGTQAHSDSLAELALVEFRILVQQAQNLKPRLFLNSRFFAQLVWDTLPPHRYRGTSPGVRIRGCSNLNNSPNACRARTDGENTSAATSTN